MFKLGIKWEKEQIFTQTDQLKNGNTLQYNALPTELRGTCHEWRAYFKVIHDKQSIYVMQGTSEQRVEGTSLLTLK